MPQRRDGEKMKVRRQCFGTLPYNRVVELSSLCSALIAALLDDYLLAVVDVDASGQVGSGGEALSHHVIVSVVASGCLVAADGGDGCGQLPVHDISITRNYLATFSRRLSIENMKIAAMTHKAMRIAQLYMSGILFHSIDGIELK